MKCIYNLLFPKITCNLFVSFILVVTVFIEFSKNFNTQQFVKGAFKTRNGEMMKWRNDEMELKTRATVIKYYRSTEISICCRIYFVVNRHK